MRGIRGLPNAVEIRPAGDSIWASAVLRVGWRRKRDARASQQTD